MELNFRTSNNLSNFAVIRAAKDGLLDVLKDATRKDTNTTDDDSMTPVLWAAFEGHLDALRLLCGRGGDPDKCDQFGNTALHLAAAKGHLHCVDFLIKFGVNIYAMDIDKHSAKDLAAINNREEILHYLDVAAANLEISEKKKSKALKELAEKSCEKRVREYMKRQQQAQENEYCDLVSTTPSASGGGSTKSTNMLSTLKQKIWSSSNGNLNRTMRGHLSALQQATVRPGTKYSDLVCPTLSNSSNAAVSASPSTSLCNNQVRGNIDHDVGCPHSLNADFKVGEREADGKRSVTSLTGLQRDSEVLYVGTFNSSDDYSNGKRGKISNLFDVEEACSDAENGRNKIDSGNTSVLARSFSQPDIPSEMHLTQEMCEEMVLQRQSHVGLFELGMGSLAFRRSVTAALSQLHTDAADCIPTSTGPKIGNAIAGRSSSNGSHKTRAGATKGRLYLNLSDTDSECEDDAFSEDEQEICGNRGALQRFLAVWALEEYLPIFQKQQIDLETLMLLTEGDIKSLALPLGPFRKLTFAIQERRNALTNPGPMVDSCL